MRTTRFLTTMAAVLSIAAGMVGQAQSPAHLAEMGQVKRAKEGYLKMYHEGQTDKGDLFYNLGKLYLISGQTDSAAFFFRKGTEIEQKNPMNWVGWARYYYQTGDSVQAKLKLKTAATLARNNQDFNLGMAEMYMQRFPGMPDFTDKYLSKALEQKSNSSAHILKGDYFLSKGDAGEAASEYKQAIFFDKRNPVPYYKSGIVYSKGRIYQEAINSMQKAIACDSGFIPAYRELGEIYLLHDKYRLAHESYTKYISLIEPDTRDLIRYASILVLDKDFESASRIIARLKENNVQDPKLLRIQAYTDYETGKFDIGLINIRDFFAKADTEELIISDYEYYAYLLKKNNLDSLSIPQYLKIIELDTTRRALYETVAKIYEQKLKDFPNAAHYYELNLVNKQPPTQVDYFKIGWLYYLSSSNQATADSVMRPTYIDEASKNFVKVCEMSPTNYLGWFWQARTQALKDPETEIGLAKPFYEKALALMDSTPEKFKDKMIESLKYMGYYYYLKFENASIEARRQDIPVFKDSSLLYWNRIIILDPADVKAIEAIKALKNPNPIKKK